MNQTRRKRAALLTFVLLVGLIVTPIGLTWWQVRQYALSRALIAALVKGDDKQALTLVNEGADPNTRYKATPAPTLPQLVQQLLHRSPVPTNDSPTAFIIACGAPWNDDQETRTLQASRPDASQLVLAMLPQVANVNTHHEHIWPTLGTAIYANRVNTVRVLLEHGADANAQDENGAASLFFAISYVADKDIIRQLLAHGADPNLRTANYYLHGVTPFELAQQVHSDFVPLLKQAGARK